MIEKKGNFIKQVLAKHINVSKSLAIKTKTAVLFQEQLFLYYMSP
jgi:hypothetical protein